METKRAQVNDVRAPSATPMNIGQVCAEAKRRDPVEDEGNDLREEAKRALRRYVAHAAQHGQHFHLMTGASALKALDY